MRETENLFVGIFYTSSFGWLVQRQVVRDRVVQNSNRPISSGSCIELYQIELYHVFSSPLGASFRVFFLCFLSLKFLVLSHDPRLHLSKIKNTDNPINFSEKDLYRIILSRYNHS